jgi:hypothetical protein
MELLLKISRHCCDIFKDRVSGLLSEKQILLLVGLLKMAARIKCVKFG